MLLGPAAHLWLLFIKTKVNIFSLFLLLVHLQWFCSCQSFSRIKAKSCNIFGWRQTWLTSLSSLTPAWTGYQPEGKSKGWWTDLCLCETSLLLSPLCPENTRCKAGEWRQSLNLPIVILYQRSSLILGFRLKCLMKAVTQPLNQTSFDSTINNKIGKDVQLCKSPVFIPPLLNLNTEPCQCSVLFNEATSQTLHLGCAPQYQFSSHKSPTSFLLNHSAWNI